MGGEAVRIHDTSLRDGLRNSGIAQPAGDSDSGVIDLLRRWGGKAN